MTHCWEYGERCEFCGCMYPELQTDHIVPKFEGVSDEKGNKWKLCPNCHHLKTLDELRRCQTGRVVSIETRQKIGNANRGKGSGSVPQRTHVVSEDARRRSSISNSTPELLEQKRNEMKGNAYGVRRKVDNV